MPSILRWFYTEIRLEHLRKMLLCFIPQVFADGPDTPLSFADPLPRVLHPLLVQHIEHAFAIDRPEAFLDLLRPAAYFAQQHRATDLLRNVLQHKLAYGLHFLQRA